MTINFWDVTLKKKMKMVYLIKHQMLNLSTSIFFFDHSPKISKQLTNTINEKLS